MGVSPCCRPERVRGGASCVGILRFGCSVFVILGLKRGSCLTNMGVRFKIG